MEKTLLNLAVFIEQTVLKPDCLEPDIDRVCAEAIDHRFYAVCVPPAYVNRAARLLQGKNSKVVTVVGFPMGYNLTPVKVEEARKAVDEGAAELDMVMNVSAFKSKNYKAVQKDIESMSDFAHLHNALLKVIIETGLLTDEEIRKACNIAAKSGVDFVKTSTGFNGGGASVNAVKVMRDVLPKKIKIKASGGIRDRNFAVELIEAGADRIGTSAGINIIAS
ncbi:MAG TPA: deoxyribose-phosphate aldolase [Chitinophagales bacterium]|nr:deoxyribose-phosphate aldolase [Chitinophagales bacterium]